MQTIQASAARSHGTDQLSASQAARLLGVSFGTIRRWSDLGRLESFSTPSGTRRFSADQLHAVRDAFEPRLSRSPGFAGVQTLASSHPL